MARYLTVTQAANHLVPERRSFQRNAELRDALAEIWQSDGVTIRRCSKCGFGFSDPFVAGSEAVYNIFGGGAQHYPRDRFEFSATTSALKERGGAHRLLEIGAGSGSFLKQLLDGGLADEVTATEYDDSAVAGLRGIGGITVFQGDFRASAGSMGGFDAICLFQVMEHLDNLDVTFEALVDMLEPGGDIFVGVPNGERLDVQEKLTGFIDMPPVHIGRWTNQSMAAVARRHSLTVVDEQTNPRANAVELWNLAKYRLERRTQDPKTIVSRIESISFRPGRGALKRMAATWDAFALARAYGHVPPLTRLFRLRRYDDR